VVPGEYILQAGVLELNAGREPGESRDVTLIPLGGRRIAYGMNALVNGPLRP
jgi:urease beta subunit